MALVLELGEALEAALRQKAARSGRGATEIVQDLVRRELVDATEDAPLWDALAPEEWKRAARGYQQSHSSDLPSLPDEAVTREGIYGEHP